jgi:choline dehydrogenase-like flavoprotein
MATKKLTIIDNAMAREVTVNDAGLATGIAYIDKNTGRENHVQARIVVLAASACESARILLNSKSAKFRSSRRGLATRAATSAST